jgi:glycosyltransferase involved in cell wall biosynthesis
LLTSLIITAYNEDLLGETIKSARDTLPRVEIVVVDDASTDNCCYNCGADQVVTHNDRLGVANSRIDGAEAATGDCYIFADGHHVFEDGALASISELALRHSCIAWPRVIGLGKSGSNPRACACRGALLEPCQDKGKKNVIGNHWQKQHMPNGIVRSYGTFVPYAIPAEVFPKVRWSRMMRGQGGHEAAVSVRAFFTETDILYDHWHVARHMFRDQGRSIVSNRDWWRNHAITCRVCFGDKTWQNYWLPHVFAHQVERRNLADELNGDQIMAEHEAFQKLKHRTDAAYWRGLYHEPAPDGVE